MIATTTPRSNWEFDELDGQDDLVMADTRSHLPRKPPVRSASARYATQSRYTRRKTVQQSLRNGAHRRSVKRADW